MTRFVYISQLLENSVYVTYSGKVLGERILVKDWSVRLLGLHMRLLEAGPGSLVTLLGTAALLLMLGLGLCLLRKKSVWKVSGWHAWLGLCSAPVLFIICVSGLISLTGISAISDTDRLKPMPVTSQNDVIQRNHTQMIKSCAETPSELIATGSGATLLCNNGERWSFETIAGELVVRQSNGNPALLWKLHSGEWAGLPGRVFWMWSVLGVLYLMYSGLRDWYQKTRRSKS